ncbi:MAG TPA: hypothetical protein VFB59_05375 [Candidatus Saccharimonadales bacterium]|nr:hypothetical protein [Candidatus Saccharimonadales bacterium]
MAKETFCNSIAGELCPDCPLLLLKEVEWKEATQAGVTPFDAALDIGTAIFEARDWNTPTEEADGTEERFEEYFEGSTDKHNRTMSAENKESLAIDEKEEQMMEVVSWLQLTTLQSGPAAVQGLCKRPTSGDVPALVKAARSAYDCFMRQRTDACTLQEKHESISSVYASLVDRDMGAAVLENFARHGNLQQVREMGAKVQEVLHDIFDRLELKHGSLVDFFRVPEVRCREYLFLIAEVLKSGRLGQH